MKIILRPYIGIPLAILACILAAGGNAILGGIIIYSYLALMVAVTIWTWGLRTEAGWGALARSLVVVGIFSLFFGPGIYQELGRGSSSQSADQMLAETNPETRAANADRAKLWCDDYFNKGFWNKHVRLRDYDWCNAFPEYDRSATAKVAEAEAPAEIDQTATSASTKPDGLWK